MEWKYSEDKKHIELEEQPKRFKYLTGTRLASCVGLNPYSTPFQIWCECTRLVTPPFEETIYIQAGRTIEKLQREYISKKFPNIMSPEEYFGNIFEQVRWNFFDSSDKPFAGCWDAVSTGINGKDINMVVEFKTANDARKWENNTIPTYYELQGALYAKLLGLDRVLFVASFPSKLDYAKPENFVPSEDNTIMIVKKLKDMVFEINGKIFSLDEVLDLAKDFWHKYIETGISPEFDEKKDKEYLDIIRTSKPQNDNDLDNLCISAKLLEDEINDIIDKNELDKKQKELKTLKDGIKEKMMDMLSDGETKVSYRQYKLTGSISNKFDDKRFKKEHPKAYEQYLKQTITYKLLENKEGEDE